MNTDSPNKGFKFFAGLPEMRLFWMLAPVIVALIILNLIYLSSFFAVLSSGFLAIIAVVVFLTIYRAAKMNLGTRVERNELKNIILSLGDGLVVYDQDFKILFFNPAAERLFGVKADTIMGKAITPRDAEREELKRFAQVIFLALAPTLIPRSRPGENPQVADISFEDPVLELRVTTSFVPDDLGRPAAFMKIIQDRTREVSLIKSKSEFITVASHQLRTPINEVKWALETLSGNKSLDQEGKDLLTRTLVSVKTLVEVVEGLLDVTKIEGGKFGYSFEETDLVGFLDTVLGAALPQVQQAGIKLYFDRPKEPLPRVMIDSQRFSMVVSNLLDNAIRYNVPNGQIIVSVKKSDQDSYLEIIFKDTGIGIPPDQVPKLFGKFFRADNAVKFQTEGSGLGLYIIKNIIQAHGGQVWIESELNRGTAIHFTLPTDFSLVPPREVPLEY